MDWEEFSAKIARREKKAPRLAARRSQVGLCLLMIFPFPSLAHNIHWPFALGAPESVLTD